MQKRNNLFTAARATHFARMLLLLDGSLLHQGVIVYYSWHLDVLYILLFFIDFIPFLMFWFLRPEWELGIRVIGLMWILPLIAILLPWGVSPGLFIVFCIQIPVLVWPKPYISDITIPEQEATHDVESLFRIKCTYCGATYSYNQDSILNGNITCQNCGRILEK